MALLFRARISRSVHTSPLSFQFIKNVYKEVGYSAPLEENEKNKVLEKINNLEEKEMSKYISKRFSKLISSHRAKSGQFDCVEQLLDLPKIETSHVEKICLSFMEEVETTPEENVIAEMNKVNKPLFSKGIIPKPNVKLLEQIYNPTTVGVSVTVDGVGLSKIDSSRKHLAWSAMSGIDNPDSPSSFQHRELFSFAEEIAEKIPDADFYIFEELLPLLPKDPYIKKKVNLIKLRSTLMSLLMLRNEENISRVHTIKPNVLDVLFNRKNVANDYMEKIMSQPPTTDNQFGVEISKEALTEYQECNYHFKELISTSLLKAVAFNYLCLEAQIV